MPLRPQDAGGDADVDAAGSLLSQLALAAPPGAGGLTLLPYLEGERGRTCVIVAVGAQGRLRVRGQDLVHLSGMSRLSTATS